MKTISKKRNTKKSESSNSKPFFNLSEKSGESKFFDQKKPIPFFSVQPKLTIGQPNDKYEQEADAIADQVVNESKTSGSIETVNQKIQTKCADCDEEEVQANLEIQKQEEEEEKLQMQPEEEEEELQMKKSGNQKSTAPIGFESKLKSSTGTSNPLSKNIKQEMESGFGTDFSGVRIHNDSKAKNLSKEINAQAFTHGKDIYFNEGKFNPSNESGKHLLAHELTHVIQQTGEVQKQNNQPKISQATGFKNGLHLKNGKKETEISKKIAAQKKMWEDLSSLFSGAGRKLAGSAYDPNISYVRADFTEGKKGNVTYSSPTMYVGSAYADEADVAVRKAKLEPELLKIDRYRVKKGTIDDKDVSDSQVNTLIDNLDALKKLELISKMKAQKYITANKSMIEHIRKKMPSTSLTAGAVATADGGFEYQFDNVKIIVKPDVYNSSKVSSGAETELTPINPPTVNSPGFTWDGSGKIDKIDFIPPRHNFTFKVQTHYSSSASPTNTSGYGVGTEAGATGEDRRLRKHEGAHGEVFIKSIQDNIGANSFPTFTGAIGQNRKDFQKNLKKYNTDSKAFLDMLKAASVSSIQDVDCVGVTTIEDYYKGKNKTSPVTCKTP